MNRKPERDYGIAPVVLTCVGALALLPLLGLQGAFTVYIIGALVLVGLLGLWSVIDAMAGDRR